MEVLELDTPRGTARAHLHEAEGAANPLVLVLGHGAGGGVAAPDLQAVRGSVTAAGIAVVLVEQPYRVAGRKSAAPAHHLDAAWLAVLEQLRAGPLAGQAVATGGRSSGARVACRTAAATGATAVVCLAFPLHPPQRDPTAERKTRLPELEAVTVPVLVVQGVNDRFGMPPGAPGRTVLEVEGDHALRKGVRGIGEAVRDWLLNAVPAPRAARG